MGKRRSGEAGGAWGPSPSPARPRGNRHTSDMGRALWTFVLLTWFSGSGMLSEAGEEMVDSGKKEGTTLSEMKEAEALKAEIAALRAAAVVATLRKEAEAYVEETRISKSPEVRKKAARLAEESRRQAEKMAAEGKRLAAIALESRLVADIVSGRAESDAPEMTHARLNAVATVAAIRSEEVADKNRAAAEWAARKGSAALFVVKQREAGLESKRKATALLLESRKDAERFSSAASRAETAASLLRSIVDAAPSEENPAGTTGLDPDRPRSREFVRSWYDDNEDNDDDASSLDGTVEAMHDYRNDLSYAVYDYDGGALNDTRRF